MAHDVERVLQKLGIAYRAVGAHCQARCPYHDDRTPSWRIRRSGDKAGLHFCQACHVGGNLTSLVMHVRGYGTVAAAREWLEQFEVSAQDLKVVPVLMKIIEHCAFRMPAGVVTASEEEFSQWPTPARAELERRGLDGDDARFWDLGYAVDGRLAGRLVVPIHSNDGGALRSYVARTFTSTGRRYLYPSEAEGPDMDAVFGEVEWDGLSAQDNARCTVVVTEGAFKSMAVARALRGRESTVVQAALGGSPVPPRPAHVAKLTTFGRVVVLTDSDPPGELCGDALVAALEGHTRVARARLPEGQDADSVPPEVLRSAICPTIFGESPRR